MGTLPCPVTSRYWLVITEISDDSLFPRFLNQSTRLREHKKVDNSVERSAGICGEAATLGEREVGALIPSLPYWPDTNNPLSFLRFFSA